MSGQDPKRNKGCTDDSNVNEQSVLVAGREMGTWYLVDDCGYPIRATLARRAPSKNPQLKKGRSKR